MGWGLGVPTHTGREPDPRVQARLPKHLPPGCPGRAECHISLGYRTSRRSSGPEYAPRWLGTPGFAPGGRESEGSGCGDKAGPWARWALTATLQASALCGGTNPFAAVDLCAPWAPPVPMTLGPPAQLGPSAGTATSPPCRSVRPAPRDWPVLRVSGEVAKLPPCLGPAPG